MLRQLLRQWGNHVTQFVNTVMSWVVEWVAWCRKLVWTWYLGLCSVGLLFPKPSLEKLFAQSQAEPFVTSYRRFTLFYCAFNVIQIVHQWFRNGPIVHPAAVLVLSWVAMRAGRRDSAYVRREGRLFVIPVRLVLLVLAQSVTVALVTAPTRDWPSLVENLVLKSGIVVQMGLAFGLPLLFKHSLPWSILESAVVMAVVGPAFCKSLGVGPENRITYHDVWYSLDQTALKILEGMFGMSVHSTAVCPVEGSCVQLFAWIQVFLCVSVCSYLVWLRERAARHEFLVEECVREEISPPDDGRPMVRVLGVALIVHILVFVTLFGAVWRFLGTSVLSSG